MASKTQYKEQINQYETEIKKLRYQFKICSNSLELEKKKTKQLESALSGQIELVKELSAKKWFEFWR